ncbi:beta-D-glucosyl crocetin beta-1,6-glucosyltransferase-like protein [Tanacetum coccineum]
MANGRKDKDSVMQGVKWWKNIVLVKSFKEIEGGFVSHYGWISITGAMKYNVPIIAMPMHLNQPVNARLVVEIGMGKEVVRNNKGVLIGAKVVEIVNEVVASNLCKNIRDKAMKISDDLETKGDKDIEFVMDELLKLGQSGHKLRRVGAPLQNAKSDGFIIHSCATMVANMFHLHLKHDVAFLFDSIYYLMEAIKFNVPIIAMPMHLNQPVNARLVVEIGMGKEIERNNKGVLMGAKVADIMNEVVASNLGKNIRDKAKKISDDFKTKGDEEIDFVMDELL